MLTNLLTTRRRGPAGPKSAKVSEEMGNCLFGATAARPAVGKSGSRQASGFYAIPDQYQTIEEVQTALRQARSPNTPRHGGRIARCAYRSSCASEKRRVVAGWTRIIKPDPGHRLHQVQHLDRGAVVRWALPPRHLCGHAEPVPAGDFYRRPHARGASHPAHLSTARGARAEC